MVAGDVYVAIDEAQNPAKRALLASRTWRVDPMGFIPSIHTNAVLLADPKVFGAVLVARKDNAL
jgi:hypothetical protein